AALDQLVHRAVHAVWLVDRNWLDRHVGERRRVADQRQISVGTLARADLPLALHVVHEDPSDAADNLHLRVDPDALGLIDEGVRAGVKVNDAVATRIFELGATRIRAALLVDERRDTRWIPG